MKSVRRSIQPASDKSRTGILGFDHITGGGLPRGRTTLLVGGPGSGKTIFGMQFLVDGAMNDGEPGIFVAFEEAPDRIVSNLQSFGWPLAELQRTKLSFMDAQPLSDVIRLGDFDLEGMLAGLGAQVKTMGAKRVVFDAIDVVLALLPDHVAKRREVYRLHEWLLLHGLTALITSKAGDDYGDPDNSPLGFMQFMVDCSVLLTHGVSRGVSQRSLRVQKYRGSAFDENEAPFLIGKNGFNVGTPGATTPHSLKVSHERVSSGVKRLDTMLRGGYFRGASVLITGFPGTAKTTMSGAFAQAACERGERTTFVSFDSDSDEIIRNLTSVGIHFDAHVKNGSLNMISARSMVGSAESLLVRIKLLTSEHKSRCLVIDPVSTFARSGNELTAHGAAERLVDWCKADGITLVCTSLLEKSAAHNEAGTPLQISTLADTWIHLDYLVQSGERNRGMSIIKSRGTSHSNQVRELILSDSGITLADIYAARGEVLMGTLRLEKERAEKLESENAELGANLKSVRLDAEQAELEVRLKSLQTELVAKQVEKTLLARETQNREHDLAQRNLRMRKLRGDESVDPEGKS